MSHQLNFLKTALKIYSLHFHFRRSIHSYKVTETTRKTVTKDKDGNIIEDISVDKVTSETDGKIEPAGRLARLLRVLPGLLLLLILAALAYYVTAVRFFNW